MPQEMFYKKHRFAINLLVAFGLGSIIWAILTWLLRFGVSISLIKPPNITASQTSGDYLLYLWFKYLAILILGTLLVSRITGKLNELWPNIELQIGPDHELVEKRRRYFLGQILVLGILPIIGNIVYEILR